MARLNPAPQSLFCVLSWKLGLHFIKKKKIHMFNHMWHALLKYYCFVAVLWRKYSSWPWTSFDFPPLPDLNQIPFHSFRNDLEGLEWREHFLVWNFYLCPLALSLVMNFLLFGFRLEFGTEGGKKSWMNGNMERQLKVKLKSGTLSTFAISDETAHRMCGSANKSLRLYEKMINAYWLKHD